MVMEMRGKNNCDEDEEEYEYVGLSLGLEEW